MKYALGRKVMLTNSHSDYFKEQHTLLTATEPSENMLWTTQYTIYTSEDKYRSLIVLKGLFYLLDFHKIFIMPRRNFGWHIKITPSVRPSITNRVSAISHKLLKQI